MAISTLVAGHIGPYTCHPLHGEERTWPETNCYVDLWIEVLNSRGLEPLAGLAFTLGLDYEGDQFTFYKFPLSDLRLLYGIEVQELNIWRPLIAHSVEQTSMGRMLMPEVDAFYLPDTAGVSYRYEHGKTTIAIASIDVDAQTLQYFHGRSLHTLGGNDFIGIFRLGEHIADISVLPPYAEIAKLDAMERLDTAELVDRTMSLTRMHLAAAPTANPVLRYAERLASDLNWLRTDPHASFHLYAFATVRQAGSCFGLTSAFLTWLDENGRPGLRDAAASFERISSASKTIQFKLARMARQKREMDLGPDVAEMAAAWDEGMSRLTDRLAR